LWAFIRQLNEAGHTIVLTTHYLEEAENLCTRIAMLKAGRVVALDTTVNLLRRFSAHSLRLRTDGAMPVELVRDAAQNGGWWSLPFDGFEEVEPMLTKIRAAGCRIDDLEIGKPDLEEVFVRVMQGSQQGQLS
jgi:ABC-2 type transport system ATP-binding protein